MQKVEGHITFHTAMSTAFPQPAPGTAPSPGPMKVAADRLRKVLGVSRMSFHDVNHPIAITDVPLEESMQAFAGDHEVIVDGRRFHPAITAVPAGTTVTWTNRDGAPHSIVSTERHFTSPMLDAGQRFSRRFDVPGTYAYRCSLNPTMTGQIVVG
jgi:plastocyanin